jgi:hypothetical protein
MADMITEESDPETWNRLRSQWLQEKKPAWIVTSNTTYQVYHLVGDVLAFKLRGGEELYDSTSFVR